MALDRENNGQESPKIVDLDDSEPIESTSVKQADSQQLSSSHKGGQPHNIDSPMIVKLPVSIELDRTKMDIPDILALGPGSM